MSNYQMEVLACINRHPEGITTSEIIDELRPGIDSWDRACARNHTHHACRSLKRFGMIVQLRSGNGFRSLWGPADY